MNTSKLINREAAGAYLNELGDPVVRTIMDMVHLRAVLRWQSPTTHPLGADLDMRFLAEVLNDVFADRAFMKRVLDGERPGAWDD